MKGPASTTVHFTFPAHDRIVGSAVGPGDVVIDLDGKLAIRLMDGWLGREGPYKFDEASVDDESAIYGFLRLKDLFLSVLIANFFERHRKHERLCELGVSAMTIGNMSVFGPLPVMPDTSTENSSANFDDQWDSLIDKAKPGDLLFTRQTNSPQSMFIAGVDKGSWSHVMFCGPDRLTHGMETDGPQIRPIASLRSRKLRVGLYRYFLGINKKTAMEIWEAGFRLAPKGSKYNYLGALEAGIRAMLLMPLQRGKITTPNGLIYGGRLSPVAFA